MDSLQLGEVINLGFTLGFEYGKTWFILFLIVIIGVFIYKLIKGL